MQLFENLIRLRKERGLSQEAVAEAVGTGLVVTSGVAVVSGVGDSSAVCAYSPNIDAYSGFIVGLAAASADAVGVEVTSGVAVASGDAVGAGVADNS